MLSIAFSYPWPKVDNEASGANADAIAALVMNYLREVEFDIVFLVDIVNGILSIDFYQVRSFK